MSSYTSVQLLTILQIRSLMNPNKNQYSFNMNAICKLCELNNTYNIKFEEMSFSDIFEKYNNSQYKLVREYAEIINGDTNIKYVRSKNIQRTLDNYHFTLCEFIKNPVLEELSYYVIETSKGNVKFISKDDELSFFQAGWFIESKIDSKGRVAIKSIRNTRDRDSREINYTLTIPTIKVGSFFENFPEYRELDARIVEMLLV